VFRKLEIIAVKDVGLVRSGARRQIEDTRVGLKKKNSFTLSVGGVGVVQPHRTAYTVSYLVSKFEANRSNRTGVISVQTRHPATLNDEYYPSPSAKCPVQSCNKLREAKKISVKFACIPCVLHSRREFQMFHSVSRAFVRPACTSPVTSTPTHLPRAQLVLKKSRFKQTVMVIASNSPPRTVILTSPT
jgi:hypothetical protein